MAVALWERQKAQRLLHEGKIAMAGDAGRCMQRWGVPWNPNVPGSRAAWSSMFDKGYR